jgi:hypothetical protein
MDTRFWGPSGWKLLHLISLVKLNDFHAPFLETIPYILPCKFCRASLTDYYRKHPYEMEKGRINPKLNMEKWMFTIHNCVNDKLRSQGLHAEANPTYSEVKKNNKILLHQPWNEQLALLWDFLFAVAYNHPKETIADSKPMPDCPKTVLKCKDHCEKNKWNVLSFKKRYEWFRRFWLFLPAVLPWHIHHHWEKVEKINKPTLECRRSTLAWLWRMRCGLDAEFHDPYTSICKKIATYSSDCGSSRGAITCRKKRSNNMTKKTKQRK